MLRKIARTSSATSAAIAPFADCRTIEELRVHFETGNDQAWQAEVNYETRERLWAACTPEIKSLLNLKW